MNPCLMDWKSYTSGVTFEGDHIIIPYPPPRDLNYPLSEEVLLSKPFILPKKISLVMEVHKTQLSENTWQEFAVFLADDVDTWGGREVGFRFPLNMNPNQFTCYLQYPILWKSTIKDYETFHSAIEYKAKFSITFNKIFLNLYKILFIVRGVEGEVHTWGVQEKVMYAWLPNKIFNLALVSHNWNTLEAQDLYLKIWDVTFE